MVQSNRISEEWEKWAYREQSHSKLTEVLNSRAYARKKIAEINRILTKFPKPKNQEERFSSMILKIEKKRLMKIGYKNNWRFVLYLLLKPIKAGLAARKLRHTEAHKEQQLRNVMERSGFGEYVDTALQKIRMGFRDFSIPVQFRNTLEESTDFKLNLKYDADNGHSFQNYQAYHTDKKNPGIVRQHEMATEFDLSGPHKAANLIAGRFVLDWRVENGMSKQEWIQFDLTDKDAKGNYRVKTIPAEHLNLEQSCKELPFWNQITTSQSIRLMNGLEKGDRHELEFEISGKKTKIFLEANPVKGEIQGFDDKGKSINLKKAFGVSEAQTLNMQPTMKVVKSPNQQVNPAQERQHKEQVQTQQVRHRLKPRSAHKRRP